MTWFRALRERSTADLLVLMIAFTVCFSVLASGALVGLISIWRPDVDLTIWVARISGLMNTMVGLLAGFLAGRTDVGTRNKKANGSDEEET